MRQTKYLQLEELENGEYYEEPMFKEKQLNPASISMAFLDEESIALLLLFIHSTLSNFVSQGPWSGYANGSVLYIPPWASFIAELFALLLALALLGIDSTSIKIPKEWSRNIYHIMVLGFLLISAAYMRYVSSHYLSLVNSQIITHFELTTTAFFSFLLIGVAFSYSKITSVSVIFIGVSMITILICPGGNSPSSWVFGFALAITSSFIGGFTTVG
jgi:drug/metabolite transporter (DMT)-like permease